MGMTMSKNFGAVRTQRLSGRSVPGGRELLRVGVELLEDAVLDGVDEPQRHAEPEETRRHFAGSFTSDPAGTSPGSFASTQRRRRARQRSHGASHAAAGCRSSSMLSSRSGLEDAGVLESVQVLEDDDVLRLAVEVVDDLVEVLVEERLGGSSRQRHRRATGRHVRDEPAVRHHPDGRDDRRREPPRRHPRGPRAPASATPSRPLDAPAATRSRYRSAPTAADDPAACGTPARFVRTAILLKREFFPTLRDAP